MNTAIGTVPMEAVLTMLNSFSRHDRRWLVEQMSAQVEREEAEAERRFREMLEQPSTWKEESDERLDAALARFHKDWGGDREPMEIANELRQGSIMTAALKTIQASPMAPIIDMVKGADLDVMHAVVEYMNEAIREAEEAKRKAEDEFLAKKMAEIEISPEIDELVDWLRLTPEEAADERTRWILGLDRK